MKTIKIKSIDIENFKGCAKRHIDFDDRTFISGANATGKTTIFDAFTFCLFGTDSSGAVQFDMRPLDENGEKVHNIVISVSVILDIDGETHELQRTASEKWVKKRGTETAVLQGNTFTYLIDGYPRTEKEFSSYVEDVISTDVFKMVTNPVYFANLHWRQQREVLMTMFASVPDADLARSFGGYEEILDELEKAPGTDDIDAKYRTMETSLKKRQAEIPVRIDEISKHKVPVDVEMFLRMKTDAEKVLASLEDEDTVSDDVRASYDRIAELKKKQMEIRAALSKDIADRRSETEQKIAKNNAELSAAESKITAKKSAAESLKRSIADLAEMIEKKREEYASAKEMVFDESAAVCPMCKRPLPEGDIEKHRKEFEETKRKRLDAMEIDGNKAVESKKSLSATLKSILAEIEAAESEVEKLKTDGIILASALKAIPTEIDFDYDKDYSAVSMEIKEIEDRLASADDTEEKKLEIEHRKQKAMGELRIAEDALSMVKKNEEIDARIAELEAELKDVSQKMLDCEKVRFLVGKFIGEKMDRISAEINGKFNGVEFTLFKRLINGGIEQCCECSVNGVPYSSLNSGHRIIAGLEIIKTLQTVFDVMAPVWLDNAETVNMSNYPAMANQMIFLSVTEDKELSIR